jgi:hypothetical protein
LARTGAPKKIDRFLRGMIEHEAAIKVCEQALSYDLKDGTKGGFKGRIDRIRKSAA